ncbi:von Willebrand factor A domain-containing protein 5A isoform X2 [Xenopus laevis]|uniref:von Willebrand factor A domain-containing protein 5A isoform X2 n=1 Tax=Xenopus laevis TaxID=8355 RepID=A0A8J1LCI5_XENLA|nr:von Willebrand factor A domain-containing protein 5A isoform X2 [Xenopus laevis]
MAPFCGLIIVCSRQPVPLRGISVEVQVKGFVADVCATLKYKNIEEKPIEAVFVFPLDQDSAVYSFEATVEGKKIVADIQEREQANKTYNEAISKGQQAFLLQEDQSSGDIFSCSVGNLPSGQEAEVKLNFVRELPLESDGAVRFVLPAVLNPRYTPAGHEESITAQVPRVPIGQIPYTLDLTAHFYSAYGISKIQSNCDISPMEYTDSDKTAAKVSLAQGHKFERDVELLAYYIDVNKPSITVEAGLPDAKVGTLMADPTIMLNFYPSFPTTQEQSNCGEFLFLMDRSGSMECSMNSEPNAPQRIESTKETLVLLLKSLPLGCYFNIISFGSHFEFFFPETMEYTQETMEEAVRKVNQMEANMGGTEILQPLKKIYKTAVRPDHPRQLFVFTDGEVGNTKQVIEEVQRNAQNHRCVAFGIGEGASTSLIKGISRAARGTCEFITGKERMQPKVLQALKNALQPIVTEISLKWTLPPGVEPVLLSEPPSNIFQGRRAIVYAQLRGKINEGKEGEVSLEYKFKNEIFRNSLTFPLELDNIKRPTIHRLGAKALISELESGTNSELEEAKKRIIETSIQSGVVSSLTAFVAVNKETKTPLPGPPVRRDIPITDLMLTSVLSCMYDEFGNSRADVTERSCHLSYMSEELDSSAAKYSVFKSTVGSFIDAAKLKISSLFNKSASPQCATAPGCACVAAEAKEAQALFRLISLQKADGSWTLSSDLASVLGLSLKEMQENNPKQNPDPAVWVTLLAVIWLHVRCLDQRDEWELLEHKALSWIKSRAGSSSLRDYIKAGNDLLKSTLDPGELGL